MDPDDLELTPLDKAWFWFTLSLGLFIWGLAIISAVAAVWSYFNAHH